MQIFIHFINKIFKTTDKSKGADTEVLRTRLFFQHITAQNPGNIQLPRQNVQRNILQKYF